MPRKADWILKNPHHLCMVITLNPDMSVTASFPAVPGSSATVWLEDPWRARDEAILGCAESIVAHLKPGGNHEPCIERTA